MHLCSKIRDGPDENHKCLNFYFMLDVWKLTALEKKGEKKAYTFTYKKKT